MKTFKIHIATFFRSFSALVSAVTVQVLLLSLGHQSCLADHTFTVHFIGPDQVDVDHDNFWRVFAFGPTGSNILFELRTSGKYDKHKIVRVNLSDRQVATLGNAPIFPGVYFMGRPLQSGTFSDTRNRDNKGVHRNFTLPPDGSEVVVEYEALPYDERYHDGRPDIKCKYSLVIASIAIVQVVMDKQLKHVEVRESAPIRAAVDSPQLKREEYTVKHSVEYKTGWKAEGEVKGHLSILEIGIRGGIESSTSKTYEESKTSVREVTIPGNGKPYRLVWIETYQTGKAVTTINNKRYEIPFEFREGWDLQTREVRE